MGLDLEYVRCPERVVHAAAKDVEVARTFVLGRRYSLLADGEVMERTDVGRRQREIFRAVTGEAWFDHSANHESWIGRALAGDDWLHMGVITTGYGSARYLDAAQVQALVAPFTALEPDALPEECRHGYAELRAFYLAAARERQAVVVIPE